MLTPRRREIRQEIGGSFFVAAPTTEPGPRGICIACAVEDRDAAVAIDGRAYG
jgi:hypothetical protein